MIDHLLAADLLPDRLIRQGIRRLLRQRLALEASRHDPSSYVADLRTRPIAEAVAAANEQHYELPPAFFAACLGPRLKYSSCYYPAGSETLAEAEECMLELYVERAQLRDGQTVLDLGCGWGSLSLYLAERFPRLRVVAVSNASAQKDYIDEQARQRRLANVHVITGDVNTLQFGPGLFDRVVSVEMFEHLKNYERVLQRIAEWLRPEGQLFVHLFSHHRYAYHFTAERPDDWMARHFFTGGQMPAHDLLPRFQADLRLVNQWLLPGTHYQRTAEHWLENMDRAEASLAPVFAQTYGDREARRWWVYWRTFYMSCAELFGYEQGKQWGVSHYLFRRD